MTFRDVEATALLVSSCALGFKRRTFSVSGRTAQRIALSSGDKNSILRREPAPPAGLRPRSTRRGRSILLHHRMQASNRLSTRLEQAQGIADNAGGRRNAPARSAHDADYCEDPMADLVEVNVRGPSASLIETPAGPLNRYPSRDSRPCRSGHHPRCLRCVIVASVTCSNS